MKINIVLIFVLVAVMAVSIHPERGTASLSTSSALAASDGAKDKNSDVGKDEDKDSGKDEDKVTLCHFPPGSPDTPQTLSVAESAVGAHLAHGDYLGLCPCVCPPGVASCVCADGKDGIPSPASTTQPDSQRSILGE